MADDLLAPLAAGAPDECCPECGVDPCACAPPIDPEEPDPVAAAVQAEPSDRMDAVREICASPALAAFLAKRIEQLARHGHSPAGDRAGPLDRLPREALERVRHALDRLSPEGGDLDYAIAKIEIAGACLAAAWDVLVHRRDQDERRGG